MSIPSKTGYNCPHLDEAIAKIEKARGIHDKLRTWGKWWQEKATEIEQELRDEMKDALKDKDRDIEKLEAEIDDLKEEIEYLRQQLERNSNIITI